MIRGGTGITAGAGHGHGLHIHGTTLGIIHSIHITRIMVRDGILHLHHHIVRTDLRTLEAARALPARIPAQPVLKQYIIAMRTP